MRSSSLPSSSINGDILSHIFLYIFVGIFAFVNLLFNEVIMYVSKIGVLTHLLADENITPNIKNHARSSVSSGKLALIDMYSAIYILLYCLTLLISLKCVFVFAYLCSSLFFVAFCFLCLYIIIHFLLNLCFFCL